MRICWARIARLVIWFSLVGGCTIFWEKPGLLEPIPSPRPDNKCFEPVRIVPGKTCQGEVLALWGNPDRISFFKEWYYLQEDTMIVFSPAGLVSRVYQYGVSNCTLGDLIGILGPPEIIEIVTQNNQPGPPIYPAKWFHYPSRGVSFLSPCLGALEWRDCSSFHATDEITRREFYSPTTVEEIIHAAHGDPYFVFLNWSGFAK